MAQKAVLPFRSQFSLPNFNDIQVSSLNGPLLNKNFLQIATKWGVNKSEYYCMSDTYIIYELMVDTVILFYRYHVSTTQYAPLDLLFN